MAFDNIKDILMPGNIGYQVFKGEVQNQINFLAKNQHIQRKLLYFLHNHCTELPKIRHQFRKKFQKLKLKENVFSKRWSMNWYSQIKKENLFIFGIENWSWKLTTLRHVCWQNTIISFEYDNSWPKIYLVLYPSFGNLITHITKKWRKTSCMPCVRLQNGCES